MLRTVVRAPDIPGHRVTGVLGTGGFATVYRSWQLSVGREVAVKVDNRVLASERDRRRFVREVTAAGRLSGHPHVIDVYDAGALDDGRPFLVMELCPAGSLNDALRASGPMSPGQVRDIGIRIADALAAAHAAGVLHRDIKPANILVNRYGMVGLADFGLASILARGEQTASRDALTPAYASPESFRSEEPTAAGDIYSLAATLHALLAGLPPRFPPDAPSPGIATIMALHDKPVDAIPGVPRGFMDLLRSSLAADPALRPPSAAALRDALAGLTGRAAGQPAHAAGLAGPRTQPRQARPGAPAAASAGVQQGGPPARRPPDPVSASGPAGPTAGRPVIPRRPRGLRLIAFAAAFIVIAGAAALIGARLLPHAAPAAAGPDGRTAPGQGRGPASAAAVFGVPTLRAGCPAVSVRAARARCPAAPECWAGMVVISGAASARGLPCTQPHYWETFAIALLPADARTYDQPALEANATVRAVCSLPVLMRSRQPHARLPAAAWQVDVLPPTQAAFDSGTRTYRCVAAVIGKQPRTSQFRR
jgi:hypothetical protein